MKMGDSYKWNILIRGMDKNNRMKGWQQELRGLVYNIHHCMKRQFVASQVKVTVGVLCHFILNPKLIVLL